MNRIVLIFMSILTSLVTSCSTDFEVNDEWDDITVVYGLLNQNDSIHYIKVNKTFLGEADAYKMAQTRDSLYYKELTVLMEEWYGDYLVKTITLEETESYKDTGLFANEENIIYTTAHKLNPEFRYKLKIIKPNNEIVSASTKLLKELDIETPTSYKPRFITFTDYEGSFTAEWKSTENARLYELTLRFHYLEVSGTDTIEKSIDWVQPSKLSSKLEGNENMTQDIFSKGFFNFIKAHIPVKEGVKRIAQENALDFIFMIGSDELNTYIEVSRPSQGIVQEKPTYTNIENGIGIFASRFDVSVNGKKLSDSTIDSLAYGIYTKNLGFVSSDDIYYSTFKR